MNQFFANLPEDQREEMFRDLFDHSTKQAMDAIVRGADLMDGGAASALLIIGVAATVYESIAKAVAEAMAKRGTAENYQAAQAFISAYEGAVDPIIQRMREAISVAVLSDDKIADAVASVKSQDHILRGEG